MKLKASVSSWGRGLFIVPNPCIDKALTVVEDHPETCLYNARGQNTQPVSPLYEPIQKSPAFKQRRAFTIKVLQGLLHVDLLGKHFSIYRKPCDVHTT